MRNYDRVPGNKLGEAGLRNRECGAVVGTGNCTHLSESFEGGGNAAWRRHGAYQIMVIKIEIDAGMVRKYGHECH
jgi:hypothetical protein